MLSSKAVEELVKLGIPRYDFMQWARETSRDDPRLIEVIERLGKDASAPYSDIKVVEIPDDVKDWYIHKYDGLEWICEGRTWGKELQD